ncbi:MAG: hypothetical protein NTV74_07450, partial [Euryarchaeota archaeon]|nr:hypothetical protein [Euryarchaeota archaeon]
MKYNCTLLVYCCNNSRVLSRNYFLLEKNKDDSAPMRKLNQKKIRWIIKEIDKEEKSTYRIAK